jgi:hypothetical protein
MALTAAQIYAINRMNGTAWKHQLGQLISDASDIVASEIALTDAYILVGNGSNVGAGVAVSGDVTIANTGAVTIAANAVEYSMLVDFSGQGYVLRGGAAGAPEEHDASGDGQILIGDGTDISSVAVSGDLVIDSAGKALLRGGGLKSVAVGTATLSTVGDGTDAVHTVTNAAVKSGDLVFATLVSDDAGTSITRLECVAAAGSFTITRNDDASSTDDGVVDYVVLRGDESFIVASGTSTMNTAGGVHAITATGAATNDIALVSLVSDDTGTPIPYTSLHSVCTSNTLTVTNAADDASTLDDAVIQYAVIRPAKVETTLVSAGVMELDTAGGVCAWTDNNIKAGDHAVVSLLKDDTGTPITSMVAVCTANTLTVTRTDDVSSADDGAASYAIYRTTPASCGYGTLPSGGALAVTDLRIGVGDFCFVGVRTDDSGTAISSLLSVVTEDTLTVTRNDDGSSADDGVVNWACFRP